MTYGDPPVLNGRVDVEESYILRREERNQENMGREKSEIRSTKSEGDYSFLTQSRRGAEAQRGSEAGMTES